ncbi:TPA: hypothetical protein ACNUTR_003617 [Vibrio cholerae]|tara:strand:+ start:4024 stop:4269 length:246 start_codon:yes stop_codon:yes gene_type:complete
MLTPLRVKRQKKFGTLEALQSALQEKGLERTVAYLSRLERNQFWPSKEVVKSLVEVFEGELSQDEILNPEQYKAEGEDDAA